MRTALRSLDCKFEKHAEKIEPTHAHTHKPQLYRMRRNISRLSVRDGEDQSGMFKIYIQVAI